MSKYATKKTKTKIMLKKDFQEMRKQLKAQGFNVKKTECGNGYELKLKNGDLLLKAVNGRNGYLVRYVDDLFC